MHQMHSIIYLLLLVITGVVLCDQATVDQYRDEVEERVANVLSILSVVNEKLEELRQAIEDVEIAAYMDGIQVIIDDAPRKSDLLKSSRDTKKDFFQVQKLLGGLYHNAGGFRDDLAGAFTDIQESGVAPYEPPTSEGGESAAGGADSPVATTASPAPAAVVVDSRFKTDCNYPDGSNPFDPQENYYRLPQSLDVCIELNFEAKSYRDFDTACNDRWLWTGSADTVARHSNIAELIAHYPNLPRWWVGLEYWTNGQGFKWQNDEATHYDPSEVVWGEGQPDLSIGHCVMMDGTKDYTLQSADCEEELPYMCSAVQWDFY